MQNNIKEFAFKAVMGDPDMPAHDAPEYDRWLFDKTWKAALVTMEVMLKSGATEQIYNMGYRRGLEDALREGQI